MTFLLCDASATQEVRHARHRRAVCCFNSATLLLIKEQLESFQHELAGDELVERLRLDNTLMVLDEVYRVKTGEGC
jgi:hypothetical protein